MVRPGLLLYGYGEHAAMLGLKPAMTLKTTVSTIKTYDPDTKISYGGIYTTEKRTRMGVLPYGYADGFFRSLSNRCSLMTVEGPAPQRGKRIIATHASIPKLVYRLPFTSVSFASDTWMAPAVPSEGTIET